MTFSATRRPAPGSTDPTSTQVPNPPSPDLMEICRVRLAVVRFFRGQLDAELAGNRIAGTASPKNSIAAVRIDQQRVFQAVVAEPPHHRHRPRRGESRAPSRVGSSPRPG